MQKCAFLIVITISVLTTFGNKAFAQPAWTTDVLNKEEVKPAKFEDKQLGSEKSAQKKFSRFRHFVQNTITHFNYYYDANNRINLVVEKATFANKDDYTKLLSFYPYSLNSTAAQKKDLDSVILKCTAGILLHDLRNDWIDNMYLLLGKAYFFRKDFDSAEATFQFINYNLFPRKKDEDDNRVVGTNLDASNGTLSIANKEKLNIFQKIASQPPSRNDALVWLARTLVEENNYGDAAGLINTLQFDPNLPPRLQDDVQEVDAYFFFSQGIYDSAANHLERSLTNSTNLEDKARREFLLAQLSEMDHNFAKATFYYNKAASNTNDPLMNIYAQVNNAKMLKTTDPQQLDISINNLLQMVKKDKFDIYRNILYYSAGQLAMQKPDTNAAITYYKKCLENSQTDVSYKNKALVQLGDIVYNRREYKKAFSLYDSLQTGDTSMKETLKNIQDRRNLLSKIVEKLNIIDREDSLQTIAAMPPAERDAFVKRLSRKLNKDKNDSTADNDNDFGLAPIGAGNNNSKPPDLFGSSSSTSSGDWYFYNASLMAQGQTDFKTKWGTRPNSDNWNRKSALDAQKNSGLNNPASMNPDAVDSSTNKDT
jgi:hypothetical protein